MSTNMPPAVNEQSQSDSSSVISSPPQSPQNTTISPDEIAVARPKGPTSAFGEGVVGATSAYLSQNHTPSGTFAPQPLPHQQPQPAAAAPVKVKKPRKPREPKEPKPAPDGQPVKEKKARKPREPKVKTEGTPNAAPRKRLKAGDKAAPATPSDAPGASRQSTLIAQFYPPGQPASAPQPLQAQPSSLAPSPQPQYPSSSGDISRNIVTTQSSAQSQTQMPRPYSSGQNYDPIRGATYDHAPSRPAVVTNGAQSAQASPQINRASASPSIQSLIDPPQPTQMSTPAVSHAQQANLQLVPQQTASFVNVHLSPKPTPVPSVVQSLPPSPLPAQPMPSLITSTDGAMDIDTQEAPQQPTIKQTQSKSSSSAATPKPSKPASPSAKASAKVGSGSGLLSGNTLFGGPSSEVDSESQGLTIEFTIALNPAGGNSINVAKEIIKKYGSDAVDPHAVAHRSRLRAVALAQNKLEANSTDDMSVDLGSELDGDSNVEMGGMDDERSGAGGEPAKKRRKKAEEYDKEDDFIDDRELAWEENAAVAKDGFFVYSGPLVAEGEAAQVESTAPTRARGGARGRGRGRGGAAAAAAAAGATAGTTARKDPNTPAVPARGRGSRGGRGTNTVPRKRVAKADKEKVEAEKAQREQLLAKPQHVASQAPGNVGVKSPALAMETSTVPAPVQPQHVLHSNYNGALSTGEAQRPGLQA